MCFCMHDYSRVCFCHWLKRVDAVSLFIHSLCSSKFYVDQRFLWLNYKTMGCGTRETSLQLRWPQVLPSRTIWLLTVLTVLNLKTKWGKMNSITNQQTQEPLVNFSYLSTALCLLVDENVMFSLLTSCIGNLLTVLMAILGIRYTLLHSAQMVSTWRVDQWISACTYGPWRKAKL